MCSLVSEPLCQATCAKTTSWSSQHSGNKRKRLCGCTDSTFIAINKSIRLGEIHVEDQFVYKSKDNFGENWKNHPVRY